MLQHKQEERELKRYEGDIIKKQHHLRRTMAEYENSKSWARDLLNNYLFIYFVYFKFVVIHSNCACTCLAVIKEQITKK